MTVFVIAGAVFVWFFVLPVVVGKLMKGRVRVR